MNKTIVSFFLKTCDARYDFDFSLGTASENGHNARQARYERAPCYCKTNSLELRTILFCLFRYGSVCIFHYH